MIQNHPRAARRTILQRCCIDESTKVNSGVWYTPGGNDISLFAFPEIDLMELDPPPARIDSIQIGSSGWDGRTADFKNVRLVGGEPICPGN